jgi:phospholipid-binding lipoprotein MlaA
VPESLRDAVRARLEFGVAVSVTSPPRLRRIAGLASAAALVVSGCATATPPGAAPGAVSANPSPRHDPFEGANRGLYRLGDLVDKGVVHPILAGYRRIFPRPIRRAVHNVVQNLDEPVVFVNDVLQAHPKAAAKTAVRFFANSTVGVAGIFDAASTAGLPHHDNGFGSTMGRWGVPPGPYIFLPVFGPTTLRDAAGDGVDWFTDPLSWARFPNARPVDLARTGLSLLDDRESADAELRALQKTAVDPYASLRAAYLLQRQSEVKGADFPPLEPLPEVPEPSPPTGPAQPGAAPPASPPQPSPEPPAEPPAAATPPKP